MIPDWLTNSVYLASTLPNRHHATSRTLLNTLHEQGVAIRWVQGTKDIWLRDFMPIQVAENEFVKFRYEPDYLRNGYKHLMTRAAICRSAIPGRICETSGINLDGGNIVAAERTAIFTEKVFAENPQISKAELRATLCQLLRVDRCIFVPQEPGDILGHADGMVRFLDERTVLVNDYSGVNRTFGKQLTSLLRRHGLTCEPFPYSVDDEISDEMPSAVGCYVNFLWVGSLVVVPSYGTAADERARGGLANLLPRCRVVSLNCIKLAKSGGILNCVSWTVSDRAVPEEGSH